MQQYKVFNYRSPADKSDNLSNPSEENVFTEFFCFTQSKENYNDHVITKEVLKMADENIATEPVLLNSKMDESFDWSDDKNVVRDAIWNHIMESNGHDTDKTAEAMKPIIDMDGDTLRAYVEKNLK